jgi:hypothetical protein
VRRRVSKPYADGSEPVIARRVEARQVGGIVLLVGLDSSSVEDSQVNILAQAIEDSRISIGSLDELVAELHGIRDAIDRVNTTLERIADDQGDS